MGDKNESEVLRAGDDIVLSAATLERVIRNVLLERQGDISPETHRHHHEYLSESIDMLRDFLDERRRRAEFWQGIRNTAVGTAVVAVVGGVISALGWLGHLVIQAIHHGANPR